MAIMKHVGEFQSNPCVVLFREVPNEPENCLIVESAKLPPQMHDDLMMFVQSGEAQEANEVSQVLSRKQFSDGSNALNALHFNKHIRKVPVNTVMLTPTPSQKISLAEVNAEIRKMAGDEERVQASAEPAKAPDAVPTGDPDSAQSMLVQAELMAEDAKRLLEEANAKKEQAYKLDPTLKPKDTASS